MKTFLTALLGWLVKILLTSLSDWIEKRATARRAQAADDLEAALDLERRAREAEGRAHEVAMDDPGGDLADRLRKHGL